MNFIKSYRLFFGSTAFGILLWLISYLLLPVETTEVIRSKAIAFVTACYIALLTGFCLSKTTRSQSQNRQKDLKYYRVLILFIFCCFILRWVDLFYFREISFSNGHLENRNLSNIFNDKGGMVFILASIFKTVYFFPFIIVIKNRYPINLYSVVAFCLMFLPLLEAFLLGNRKPFFETFLVIVITLLFYKKLRITLKTTSIFVLSCILLMIVSYKLLLARETSRKGVQNVYNSILESRYNEILKPQKDVIKLIKNPDASELKRNTALILLQSGQYINHGFFEFNHIIDRSDLPITYGQYNFHPILKFLDRAGIVESSNVKNPSPRKYVYLTAFGSFYLDFRWLTVLLFFVFGMFQRFVYNASFSNMIMAPLLIYLAIINVFLPVMNITRGAGFYPFVAFVVLWTSYKYCIKKADEKSINT